MFNYLRADNVWDKFKSINDNIRAEMEHAEVGYSTVNPDKREITLRDCWDEWMEDQFDRMVQGGRDWIAKAISQMKELYDPDKFQGQPDLVQRCQAIQAQLTILGTKAARVINRDYFDLGHGTPMDTSD